MSVMQTPFTAALDAALLARGITRYRLAQITGTTEGHVYNVLSGKRKLGRALIPAWSAALGIPEQELLRLSVVDKYGFDTGPASFSPSVGKGTTEGMPISMGELGIGAVPLYVATAGAPFMWTVESRGSVPISSDLIGKVDGALIVRGNSVSARGIVDGSIVLVQRLEGSRPQSGKLVVVETEGAFMVKVFRVGPGGDYLESHEIGKDPEIVAFSDDVRLVGRVRAVMSVVD